jgi:hypothetical protein
MHHRRHHPIQWLEKELGIMAAPINVSVAFDKASYAPGDTVTGTVTWSSGEEGTTVTVNVSVNVTNQNGESTIATGSFSVSEGATTDSFTVEATDDGNRSWSVQDGGDSKSATITTTA